jgi:hypothetical protein
MVPHIAAHETHQWSLKISIFTRKRLFQQYPPRADIHQSDVTEYRRGRTPKFVSDDLARAATTSAWVASEAD